MTKQTNLIKIGVISSVHGVRGQVKIHGFIEDVEDILSYSPLTDATGKRHFKLTRRGIKDKLLIVSIDGIDDRNEAELLKGVELFAPAPKPQKQENGRWSYGALTGLEARLLDGNVYGRVIHVHNFGAGDILDIELGHGKSEMLPMRDEFVGDVRIEEGYLIVFPPDYIEAK